MEIKLKDNERIDDLQYKGLKIIQNKTGFCFGIDSVLISDFASQISPNSKIIDLGTGSGIIGLLLCKKIEALTITGVEIQEEVSEMAKRSIKLNQLEDKFSIINKNIIGIDKVLGLNKYDAVVTNPPYVKNGTGIQNENEKKVISRHEITASLEDFIRVSHELLKDKGCFYMVHKPERLADIICILRKYKLEPKILRFVHPKKGQDPNIVLVKAVKNAKTFLKVQNPLYVYNENGEYSEEILKIYDKVGN